MLILVGPIVQFGNLYVLSLFEATNTLIIVAQRTRRDVHDDSNEQEPSF